MSEITRKKLVVVQSKQHSLTEGSIWKSMLLFALPVLLGNIMQQLYNAFDAWCVGNYIGDDALAAVTSSGSLIFMLISFFNGVAMGAGVVIARAFGAKQYDTMKKTIHTAVAFGLVAGAVLTVMGVVLTPIILRWMGTPAEVLPQSIIYFRYYFYGILFTVMYNVFVGILHAVGDSKHPLYYLCFSTFLNIALDMLFVAVLGWGVGSAAIATVIAQGSSALLCFLHLIRIDAPYRLQVSKVRFHKESFAQIIRYGLPSGVQFSVISLANVVVQSNINSFGPMAMAGCGSHAKIEGFAFLPINCFTQALSTFVGQNLGAGRHDRVRKGVGFGIVCCCVLAESIGGLCYAFAPQLIGLFSESEEAIRLGAQHMRIICPFYFLLAFSYCISSILRGAGKATVPMVIMLSCWCVIRVTYVSIAVPYVNHLTTVSWAYPLTWFLSSIIFLIYFLRADWIHNFDKTAKNA